MPCFALSVAPWDRENAVQAWNTRFRLAIAGPNITPDMALTVACPQCGAAAGQHCATENGWGSHNARFDAAGAGDRTGKQ